MRKDLWFENLDRRGSEVFRVVFIVKCFSARFSMGVWRGFAGELKAMLACEIDYEMTVLSFLGRHVPAFPKSVASNIKRKIRTPARQKCSFCINCDDY